MIKWLERPYPFLINPSIQLALSMLIGLICFLFLVVFRPFGLEQVENVTYLFGFGVISSLVLLLHYFIFPKIGKKYFVDEHWTVGKQLLFFISINVLIGVGIYIYNSTIGYAISPQFNLISFIYFAFAVGILPVVFMTYFIEKVASRRNSDFAESIRWSAEDAGIKLLKISSDNQNEADLELRSSDFIYAQACGNYTEIHFMRSNEVSNSLIRASLKSVQDQIDDDKVFIRCHKSFLINKNKILNINGNARSLILNLKDIESAIPVSRKIPKSAFE